MNKTQIEWVLNPDGSPGYTFNPITGCLNHVNGMCKGGGFPCYAYRLANGRLKERYKANINVAPIETSTHPSAWAAAVNSSQLLKTLDPFYPRFWPERLYHPWGGEDKGIFVCDMSDLFGKGIPHEWTENVIDLCRRHDNNRYYFLTKQPQNLIKFSPFPDNCWVGVTATDHNMLQAATGHLRNVKATVKYISLEPLLRWQQQNDKWMIEDWEAAGINWLIIGAQTKPYKPPKIEWVDEITQAANKANISVFWKDNLHPLIDDYYRGKFRQEHPNIGG